MERCQIFRNLLTAVSDADIVAGGMKSSTKRITNVNKSKENGVICTLKSEKLKNGYHQDCEISTLMDILFDVVDGVKVEWIKLVVPEEGS